MAAELAQALLTINRKSDLLAFPKFKDDTDFEEWENETQALVQHKFASFLGQPLLRVVVGGFRQLEKQHGIPVVQCHRFLPVMRDLCRYLDTDGRELCRVLRGASGAH